MSDNEQCTLDAVVRQDIRGHACHLGRVQLHCCSEVGRSHALRGISSVRLVEADALGFKDFPWIISPFWVRPAEVR